MSYYDPPRTIPALLLLCALLHWCRLFVSALRSSLRLLSCFVHSCVFRWARGFACRMRTCELDMMLDPRLHWCRLFESALRSSLRLLSCFVHSCVFRWARGFACRMRTCELVMILDPRLHWCGLAVVFKSSPSVLPPGVLLRASYRPEKRTLSITSERTRG